MSFAAADEIARVARQFRVEGSAERAAKEQAYHKTTLRFHGVSLAVIRAAAAELLSRHPELARGQLRTLVDAAYGTEFHDLRSVGIASLEKRQRLLGREDLSWLISLVRSSAGWAHVDWLAVKVVGKVLARTSPRLAELSAWAGDEDFWVRRTALLAQLDELRAGRGDFELFARIAAPMLPERELFIRKAIGWVLREISRRRPELTFEFLREHAGEASGLTFREAAKHLPESMRRELQPPSPRARHVQAATRRSRAPGRP